MAKIIMAHELDGIRGTLDPLRSIKNTVAFSARDWAASRDTAWLYGIVFGWAADPDYPDEGDPMAELQAQHGWSDSEAARLTELHRRFAALVATTDTGGKK